MNWFTWVLVYLGVGTLGKWFMNVLERLERLKR